jgi:uncharacterized protein (DUF305 family)
MITAWHRTGGLALGLFVVLLAGPSPATAQQTGSMSMSMPAASPADAAFAHGMKEMQRQMADAPTTGNADQDFVAMMIPHHEGAIDMAEDELKYGHDPFLRRLARDIITAQRHEIANMKAWQTRHPAQSGAAQAGAAQ